MSALHIALNLVFLHERSGGVGRYALELLPALLEAEDDLRVTAFVTAALPAVARESPWSERVCWVTLPVSPIATRRGSFALSTAAQWGAEPLLAALRGVHVVHGLANVTALWAPRVARVVTLHDVVWLRYPDSMPSAATLGMRRVALPSARRADRVIAVSHAAKADIVATVGIPGERVDVVHHGIETGALPPASPEPELRERLGLSDARVVLSVSQKRAHKNLAGLISAFARLEGDALLVLPGAPTEHERELVELARRLGVADRVRFPPWVSEPDLEGLYRLATCFVLASFEEGFGLPVLEAMRRAVPVACSRSSSVGEVAGDAAELFDPHDQDDIARALRVVLDDEARRATLAAAGPRRCADFTWERAARETLASYRAAVAVRRR